MSAPPLTPAEFGAFFRALHGHEPFPWQQRLLERIAEEGGWPRVLDLPTGSGKTATLDIALFHLALDADGAEREGHARRAPVRIAFVVDRRLIVDEAHERASKIANALAGATEGVLKRVATVLRRLAGDDAPPVMAPRLRGGIPLERDWTRSVSQPTLITSTVDQVGSRLLFRGYGVTDRMRPVHAGLVGSDCLILLDEAHLAEPFRQTLDTVARYHEAKWLDDALPRAPWSVAELSATPGQGEAGFRLTEDDWNHPELGRRLKAAKPARVVTALKGPKPAKGELKGQVAEPAAAEDEGGEAEEGGRKRNPFAVYPPTIVGLVGEALDQLSRQGVTAPAIGVVVNRVGRARSVFNAVEAAFRDCECHLVIGPARSVTREALVDKLRALRTGRKRQPAEPPKPVVLVATQTIEAGVDLDLDALITEAAALDALRQRFGRLNRSGWPGANGVSFEPFAAILPPPSKPAPKDDPVYGEALAATWQHLQAWAAEDGTVDLGIAAMVPRIEGLGDELKKLLSPKADAPVLMPALLDLLTQTSPVPAPDPEVSLFLHGPRDTPEGVRIVWRADLEEEQLRPDRDTEWLSELLRVVPPEPGEAVEIQLAAARAWLAGETTDDVADVAERPAEEDRSARSSRTRRAYRWAGPGSSRNGPVAPNGLTPGDLILVPAAYGGCDEHGWAPADQRAVTDLADQARDLAQRNRLAVRVAPGLIRAALTAELEAKAIEGGENPREREVARRIAAAAWRQTEELAEEFATCLAGAKARGDKPAELLEASLAVSLPAAVKETLASLQEKNGPPKRLEAHLVYREDEEGRPTGVVFLKRLRTADSRMARRLDRGTPPATEDDATSLPGTHPMTLDRRTLARHTHDVVQAAAAMARRAGLPESQVGDIALAAALHDLGKADPRFQALLRRGTVWTVDDERLLAKSARPGRPEPGAWERAGLPDGWRHEALSVRIARAHPRFPEAHDPGLVLWLIGTHHGLGRPLFDFDDRSPAPALPAILYQRLDPGPTPGPENLTFEWEAPDGTRLDWVQLFESLQRRYGPWELARLEAALRLADHLASEEADAEDVAPAVEDKAA